ncbi:ERCC4 domain-containing protein [Sorangium sp. So ce117]|uniref:ERCC4 domain-containing protein n=1 Tax=Sorangium sp. So ce117 TaxID=3133277 RepID=UPI003F5F9059
MLGGPSASLSVNRATLSAGDYSVQGFEDRIRIERKELGDFVNCCTRERDRFVRELDKLRAFELRAIVVEASLLDVAAHRYRSRALPKAIVASAVAFHVDYGVPTIWAGDHAKAARVAEMILCRFAKKAAEKGPEQA